MNESQEANEKSKSALKILILGGGNWGTSIARIIALNAKSSSLFDSHVYIWIRDEPYEDVTLTEYVNANHENPKYLPKIQLPENLIAVCNILPLVESIDLLVFVIPHQFLESLVNQIKGHISPTAQAISLVKGLGVQDGDPYLFSDYIAQTLGIQCSVLSGANVANDIAADQFSETTIGYPSDDFNTAFIWQKVFDYPTFKVNCLPDTHGAEVCGALKNVIALAAGFCDGLNLGTNTKAAILRLGVQEMLIFATRFFPPVYFETFLDSAGYPDVITTCFGGRNVRCAEEFVKRKGSSSWSTLEAEMLNGQKLQGYLTCSDLHCVIVKHKLEQLMPLFVTVYEIAFMDLDPTELVKRFSTRLLRPIKRQHNCVPIPCQESTD